MKHSILAASVLALVAGLAAVLAPASAGNAERERPEKDKRPGRERPNGNPDNPDRDFWAAIAYSRSTGAFGYAINGASADEVERAASGQAKGPDVAVVKTFKTGWAALVVDPDGGYEVIQGEFQTGVSRPRNVEKVEERAARRGGVVALLIGHAGFVRQKNALGPGDHFAAITHATDSDLFGFAYGCASLAVAEKNSAKLPGHPKDVVTASGKNWVAYASGPGGWGLANDDTRDDTERKAIEDAAQRGCKDARIVMVITGDGFLEHYPEKPVVGNGAAR